MSLYGLLGKTPAEIRAHWSRALCRGSQLMRLKSTANPHKWRVDPLMLYPPFLRVVLDTLQACEDRGASYYATNGFRSMEEQGRRHTAYKNGTGYRAAPAGRSAHQWGGAMDFVPDKDPERLGIQADWSHAAYDVLVEEATARGLVAGRSFGDNPHIQIPAYVTGKSMAPLRALWIGGRVDGLDVAERLSLIWERFDQEKVMGDK